MPIDVGRILDQYKADTDELGKLYSVQGAEKAAELSLFNETWEATPHLGITERNATAKLAAGMHTTELYEIEGSVQTILARLRYYDKLLQYGLAYGREVNG